MAYPFYDQSAFSSFPILEDPTMKCLWYLITDYSTLRPFDENWNVIELGPPNAIKTRLGSFVRPNADLELALNFRWDGASDDPNVPSWTFDMGAWNTPPDGQWGMVTFNYRANQAADWWIPFSITPMGVSSFMAPNGGTITIQPDVNSIELGPPNGIKTRLGSFMKPNSDVELAVNFRWDGTSDDPNIPSWTFDMGAWNTPPDGQWGMVTFNYRANQAADWSVPFAITPSGAPSFMAPNGGTITIQPAVGLFSIRQAGGGPNMADLQSYDHGLTIHCNSPWEPVLPAKYSLALDFNTDTGMTVLSGRQPNAPPFAAGTATGLLAVNGIGDFQIWGANATKASGSAWINPSDPRLKIDVGPYTVGLGELSQLTPISYRLKAHPDGLCYGFDAGAVRNVMPECVGTTMIDNEEMLTLDMHPMMVALINAVKELGTRVSALEK